MSRLEKFSPAEEYLKSVGIFSSKDIPKVWDKLSETQKNKTRKALTDWIKSTDDPAMTAKLILGKNSLNEQKKGAVKRYKSIKRLRKEDLSIDKRIINSNKRQAKSQIKRNAKEIKRIKNIEE